MPAPLLIAFGKTYLNGYGTRVTVGLNRIGSNGTYFHANGRAPALTGKNDLIRLAPPLKRKAKKIVKKGRK